MGRFNEAAQGYLIAKATKKMMNMLDNMKTNKTDSEGDGKSQLPDKSNDMIDFKLRPEHSLAKAWDFSKEKSCNTFAAGDGLKLRPIHELDADFYYHICSQWTSLLAHGNSDEIWIPIMRKELAQEKSLFCAIVRESDGVSIGYISLKDTTKELWELAIELDAQYCNQGYGPAAILLFIKRVKEVTGKREFQILVEPDNTRCQKCMDKAGAEFIGVYNYIFKNPEDAIGFEGEHLDFLDDQLISLAQKIGVEPRKLLSHVLEYRCKIEN